LHALLESKRWQPWWQTTTAAAQAAA
jgi:hypothetical protein